MSASNPNSNISMSDTPKQIKDKINKHAFSGGRDTLEEHRKLGGNPDVDVAYQYMGFFVDDDDEMRDVAAKYRSGELASGEMKKKCIAVLQTVVGDFQARRKAVTDDTVRQFMDKERRIDPAVKPRGEGASVVAGTTVQSVKQAENKVAAK